MVIFGQRGKSHIHVVHRGNGLLFHLREVSELWRKTMVNTFCLVFLNQGQCSGARNEESKRPGKNSRTQFSCFQNEQQFNSI